jgi:hypothetical protein
MRWIVCIVLLTLLPGIAAACVSVLVIFFKTSDLLLPIAGGTILGILLDHVVLRRFPVVETFEHEFTHAVVALMFFRRITGFVVRRRGGTVSHRGHFGGTFGNDLIGLAPYILPTFALFSILVRPLIPPGWFPWYDVWIGVTFGYHFWSAIDETREAWTKRSFSSVGNGEQTQSDIGRRGYIYSGIFITTCTLAVHGLLIACLTGRTSGVEAWAREVWRVEVILAQHAITGIRAII